jgi:hypothetical protein
LPPGIGLRWFAEEANLDEIRRIAPRAQIVSLSRPGWSANGRQALLFINNFCGLSCSETTYVVLERDATGQWKMRRFFVMAES